MAKETTIISVKEFATRGDLEFAISSKYALTADVKVGVEIRGTREELERLQLSDRTSFWGIVCVITDTPTEPKAQVERPPRGEIKDFGLNGSQSNVPKK